MVEQDLRVLSFRPTENQVTGSRIQSLLAKKWIVEPDQEPEFLQGLFSTTEMKQAV